MMYFKSIRVENVRSVNHVHIEDIPRSGVVVIFGPNERGKSTIMEAINAALYYKHNSKNRDIRALEQIGSAEPPRVVVTMQVGEVLCELDKQFCKKTHCRLTLLEPTQETIFGNEAEEKLQQILHDNMDVALARALFVRQGGLLEELDAIGLPSLTKALDSATGTDAETMTGDSALVRLAKAESKRYYSEKTAAPSKLLKEPLAALEEAQQRLVETQQAVANLHTTVDDYERATASLAKQEKLIPQRKRELKEYEDQAAHAERLVEQLHAAQARLETARLEHAAVHREMAERQQAEQAHTEAEQELAALLPRVEEAAAAVEKERATVAALRSRIAQAQRQREEAHTSHAAAVAAVERLRAAQQLQELKQLDRTVAQLREAVASATAQRPEHPVSKAALAGIHKAEQSLREAQIQRRAAAARLKIAAVAGAEVEINGNRVSLEEGWEDSVTDPTTVAVGQVTMTVEPGAALDEIHQQVEDAQAALDRQLSQARVADVAEATRIFEKDETLAKEIKDLESRLEATIGTHDMEQVAADIVRLTQLSSPAEGEEEHNSPLSVAQAQEKQQQAATALAEAEQALKEAEAALGPWLESDQKAQLVRLETSVEHAKEQLERAAARLAQQGTAHAEELAEKFKKAAAKLSRAEAEAEDLAVESAQSNPETARQLVAGARAAVESAEAARVREKENIARYRSAIDIATGAAEDRDRAEAALAAARDNYEQVQLRAQGAKLLADLLVEHQARAQTKYTEPFSREMERLSAVVFGPDYTFNINDRLQVDSRSHGHQHLDIDMLSSGAQEQVAMLARLAVAEIVSTTGQSVPVFFDDALGYSDDQRLQRMGVVLSQCGKNHQIFVLTCVPERYSYVSGKQEFSIAEISA